MSEYVSSVKRYVGDYNGGLPDVMNPGLHDVAIDSCSGRFWTWDGQRWTMASNVTGIEVFLGAGKTLREMINNAAPQIDGVEVHSGDSDLIPVEMQGGENDLVIMHSLGNPPAFIACYYALSADDTDEKRLLAVPKTDEVISTADGYWTTWRKFGCAVSNGPCVISLLTMNATKDTGQILYDTPHIYDVRVEPKTLYEVGETPVHAYDREVHFPVKIEYSESILPGSVELWVTGHDGPLYTGIQVDADTKEITIPERTFKDIFEVAAHDEVDLEVWFTWKSLMGEEGKSNVVVISWRFPFFYELRREVPSSPTQVPTDESMEKEEYKNFFDKGQSALNASYMAQFGKEIIGNSRTIKIPVDATTTRIAFAVSKKTPLISAHLYDVNVDLLSTFAKAESKCNINDNAKELDYTVYAYQSLVPMTAGDLVLEYL